MDIEKSNRVRSYVQAQLAFVPFYGTDLIAPGGSQSEPFGLQTPLLVARNPLVTIQSESNPSFASVSIEGQSSKRGLAEIDPLTKKATESHKRRPKRPTVAKEQNQQLLTSKRGARITIPGAPSEPAEDPPPAKKKRGGRREKPRFPTGLSFLYGFTPENVGPSRLTVSRANVILNPKFIIFRYLAVIRGFLRKGSHLRPYWVPLSWTRQVGSAPSGAVVAVYFF